MTQANEPDERDQAGAEDEDAAASAAEATEDQDGGSGADEGEQSAEAKEDEEVAAEMKRVEEDPPSNLEDWPQGKAKYETFGGPEGEHGYHEGVEEKLGPSSVRHHEDGSVTIANEEVDNPEDFKGEPIPGGPTDPNSPDRTDEREGE